jgi:hypothetical protein
MQAWLWAVTWITANPGFFVALSRQTFFERARDSRCDTGRPRVPAPQKGEQRVQARQRRPAPPGPRA